MSIILVVGCFAIICLDSSNRTNQSPYGTRQMSVLQSLGVLFVEINVKKGKAVKYNRNVYQALMMISQFGINMLVPIFVCSFAGMFLDRKFGTSYWMVALFFIGALAGFTNVFKFAKKIYATPAVTRRRRTKHRDDKKEEE